VGQGLLRFGWNLFGTQLQPGDVVTMDAAGGYGEPRERDPELVQRDVREGYVTPERARSDYGVEE